MDCPCHDRCHNNILTFLPRTAALQTLPAAQDSCLVAVAATKCQKDFRATASAAAEVVVAAAAVAAAMAGAQKAKVVVRTETVVVQTVMAADHRELVPLVAAVSAVGGRRMVRHRSIVGLVSMLGIVVLQLTD